MYYPDLSPYTYDPDEPYHPTLNIGWLNGSYPYQKGNVPELFLERLWMYCKIHIYLTLGYHQCDICHQELGIDVWRLGERLTLGSAEIRVIGPQGIAYAAPNMIYHYIADHQYQPPSDFIRAVLDSPLPHECKVYQDRYGNM